MPGQTTVSWLSPGPSSALQWRAGQLPGQTTRLARHLATFDPASMEGRAIARPNLSGDHTALRAARASMEGRAIARPNDVGDLTAIKTLKTLQWRAGQLPGQTRQRECSALGHRLASMEGRAIARPNRLDAQPWLDKPVLQWRAGQLPGQTCRWRACRGRSAPLQWRAGQLPGQTRL